MSDYYHSCATPKPEPRATTKRREKRTHADHVATIRVYVFGRERGLCRICRIRRAESMHELTPRSCGGKISKRNSIAVCGTLVGSSPSCHTYIQLRQIQWMEEYGLGGEGVLVFTPITPVAAEWMRVTLGQSVQSAPMQACEVSG